MVSPRIRNVAQCATRPPPVKSLKLDNFLSCSWGVLNLRQVESFVVAAEMGR